MAQAKRLSTAEKAELLRYASSQALLMMFESYARRNEAISPDLELIRAELLIRLASYNKEGGNANAK